ncbi:MAG: hypothetical protein EP329_11000 [Deltaproteobacteria bacterium]|nr:MAG: hypothetical protein EP329_11000 [Deltaproteobacteria bacterium]
MSFAFLTPEVQQKSPASQSGGGLTSGWDGLKELASLGYEAAMNALAPKDGKPAADKGEHEAGKKPEAQPAGPLMFDVSAARAQARDGIARGCQDVNLLTDEVFFALFPWLRNVKLSPGSGEAKAWIEVRDKAAKPELKAAKDAPKKPEEKAEEKPAGGGTTPAQDVPAEFHGNGQKAGTSDLYLTQNDNSYEDGEGNWSKNAGSATCNMTAVAMALVSIAGSEEVAKQAVAAYLKKRGMRKEATAKAGSKRTSLKKIIDDPSLLAKVQLEDLCIAAAVAIGGSLDAVTMTGTMLKMAEKSGLVKGGKAYASTEKMKDPAVLARAKQLLAEGKRVIVGTVGHYVYLTAVLDDGILVHDPAGARVQVSGSPKYLWPGKADSKLGHWDGGLKGSLLPTTLRRVSRNPQVHAAFTQEAAALELKGQAKSDARAAVKQAFPGTLNTGENNFYGLDELDTYNCRIRVILEPNEEGPEKAQEGGTP